MPLDLRTTIFSDDELSEALLDYAVRNHVSMPPTRAQTVDVTWQPTFGVKITFVTDALGRDEEMNFNMNETAAALILYCHRFKEPVPHHAEKKLEPFDGGIQLLIRIPWGDKWHVKHPAHKLSFDFIHNRQREG